jgi:RNA polymerase sigma-70 factor (ECF subfamily)
MIAEESLESGREMTSTADADVGLLQDFLRGSADAFDRLFLKYQDYVYNVCLGILGNPDDARDCAQETFLRVYRKAESFRGHSQFSTWIYRIAVNVSVGHLRKRPRNGSSSLDDEHVKEIVSPDAPLGTELEREDDEMLVREVVASLAADYRTVIVLRYFQDLSYEDMVRVLGWSLPQVKIKLHRARKAFATRLAERKQEKLRGIR